MADLRILMLNLEYPPLGGGAAPVTRGLARALVGRGHQVDIITMGYRQLHAVARNVALIAGFSAVSASVAYAVVYLTPRLL